MSETAIVTDESPEETRDETSEVSEEYHDPRIAIMESMAEQNDTERTIQPGTRQEDMPAGEPVPDLEPGLQTQEQMHDTPEPEDGLPAEYEDDPLSEFIEMDGDNPMFRTVVNGQVELIPLDQARASIQKNRSADIRLREAADMRQNLEQREQALQIREQQLMQRVEAPPPAPNVGEELDKEELTEEARNVVSELFTGTQDEAAAKLADLLAKNRGATQVSTPIDPQQIASQAVAAAKQELSAEAYKKDVQQGYAKFLDDYPEVAADDNLFAFADGMTERIQKENPDWKASQVMLEAGKRTREWVESQKGENTSEQNPAQNERKERKRNLRRVPSARQGTQPNVEAEPEQTPGSYLAELRQARGLPD